jgi:hypothetical protein
MNKVLYLIMLCFIISSCVHDIPTEKDGSFSYSAVIIDTLGIFPVDASLGYAPFKNRSVTIESNSYFESMGNAKKYYLVTDNSGRITINNLACSDYLLYSEFVDTLKTDSTGAPDTVNVGAVKAVELTKNISANDTIYTTTVLPNLVINEIYYAGPVNKAFYFYDQFVELYNASNETKYLDGLIVARARQSLNPDLETNDFVQVLNTNQFPGTPLTGREYPVEPGEFILIAADALDHSQYIDTAVDLSHAGWEFYNPYCGEEDNPANNVTNIIESRTIDFMLNLVENAVVLADGSEWEYGEFSESGYTQFIHIPINTVIDAVDYSCNSEGTKEFTRRLDAGYAGVGLSKYSGKSVERRIPGFDTNNSRVDFINLDVPTPGY